MEVPDHALQALLVLPCWSDSRSNTSMRLLWNVREPSHRYRCSIEGLFQSYCQCQWCHRLTEIVWLLGLPKGHAANYKTLHDDCRSRTKASDRQLCKCVHQFFLPLVNTFVYYLVVRQYRGLREPWSYLHWKPCPSSSFSVTWISSKTWLRGYRDMLELFTIYFISYWTPIFLFLGVILELLLVSLDGDTITI